MKWLYRILRLFFCPHKWKILKSEKIMTFYKWEDKSKAVHSGFFYLYKCKRCGKIVSEATYL